MNEEITTIKWAYNVGLAMQMLFKCVKTLETYKKYVKDDDILHEVLTELRYAINKIESA